MACRSRATSVGVKTVKVPFNCAGQRCRRPNICDLCTQEKRVLEKIEIENYIPVLLLLLLCSPQKKTEVNVPVKSIWTKVE